MKSSLFSMFFLFIFILGCSINHDTSIDLNEIYTGDKIVLNGFVDLDSGCIVNLSKTAPSSGQHLNSELKFSDARLFLLENGDTITELKGDSNGRFTSTNYKPTVGSKYKVVAVSTKLPNCSSEEVILLDKPQLKNINTKIKENLIFGRMGLLFYFNLTYQTGNSNYFIYTAFKDKERDLGITFLNKQEFRQTDNPCEYFNGDYYAGFNTKCFQSSDTLSFAGDYTSGFNLDSTGQIATIKNYSLVLTHISSELYNYILSRNQPKGIEAAFVQPNILFTNIKNGYGIFYATNSQKINYKF